MLSDARLGRGARLEYAQSVSLRVHCIFDDIARAYAPILQICCSPQASGDFQRLANSSCVVCLRSRRPGLPRPSWCLASQALIAALCSAASVSTFLLRLHRWWQ